MSAWIDDVAAVLEAWMMGQAGGGALADVERGRLPAEPGPPLVDVGHVPGLG